MATKLTAIFMVFVLALSGCIYPTADTGDEIPEGFVKVPGTADCQKLTGNNEECYYKAALWENNPESCGKAGPLKDRCFRELALMEFDSELCKLAGTQEGQCMYEFAMLEIDETLCEKAKDQKALCYHQLALLTLNPELCKKTDTQFQKNLCTEEVEFEIYLKEKKLLEKQELDEELEKLLGESETTE
ncbi:MAG: hypothetical protein J7K00_02625 [Candidatus Diapherotrites archaeon]|nr:hypothetical protein [Candidatus Diapherotrites archaeon]